MTRRPKSNFLFFPTPHRGCHGPMTSLPTSPFNSSSHTHPFPSTSSRHILPQNLDDGAHGAEVHSTFIPPPLKRQASFDSSTVMKLWTAMGGSMPRLYNGGGSVELWKVSKCAARRFSLSLPRPPAKQPQTKPMLFNPPLCHGILKGITLSQTSRVIKVFWAGQMLSGLIPSSITLLSNLTQLR